MVEAFGTTPVFSYLCLFFFLKTETSTTFLVISLNTSFRTLVPATGLIHPLPSTRTQKPQLVPADLNAGYLAEFFFILAGLMILDMLGFACAAKGYTYVEIDDTEEEDGSDGCAEIHVVGQDEETVLLHDPVGSGRAGEA